MKGTENSERAIIDTDGSLSASFIDQSGLHARLLAGTPTLLELAAVSFGLRLHARSATFELYSNGSIVSTHTAEPEIKSLVDLMHDKFAKSALVVAESGSEIAFFDVSSDYFIFLAGEADLERTFHLDRSQMADYFADTIEGSQDEAYLRSVWKKYEPFM
jgi:hypothetical protein